MYSVFIGSGGKHFWGENLKVTGGSCQTVQVSLYADHPRVSPASSEPCTAATIAGWGRKWNSERERKLPKVTECGGAGSWEYIQEFSLKIFSSEPLHLTSSLDPLWFFGKTSLLLSITLRKHFIQDCLLNKTGPLIGHWEAYKALCLHCWPWPFRAKWNCYTIIFLFFWTPDFFQILFFTILWV